MSAVLSAIRFGWIVRTVGILQMKPEEKWPARSFLPPFLIKPIQRVGNALPRPAIHQTDIFFHEALGGESVVVKIEAPGQSPTAIEHKGADYCAGGIALLFEGLSDGAELRRQRLSGEILHTVLEGIRSSQNGRVRRPGERDLRDGVFEPNAVAGQSIQRRRLDICRA